MRISDWSSDVCSSDLHGSDEGFICGQAIMGLPKSMRVDGKMRLCIVSARHQERAFTILLPDFRFDPVRQGEAFLSVRPVQNPQCNDLFAPDIGLSLAGDRKSVVEGQGGASRVDSGGLRFFKKTK